MVHSISLLLHQRRLKYARQIQDHTECNALSQTVTLNEITTNLRVENIASSAHFSLLVYHIIYKIRP